jgi:hypothetical protein
MLECYKIRFWRESLTSAVATSVSAGVLGPGVGREERGGEGRMFTAFIERLGRSIAQNIRFRDRFEARDLPTLFHPISDRRRYQLQLVSDPHAVRLPNGLTKNEIIIQIVF